MIVFEFDAHLNNLSRVVKEELEAEARKLKLK
jgi:hypothetical protein